MHAYYRIAVRDENGIVAMFPKFRVQLEVEDGIVQTTYVKLPFHIASPDQSEPDDLLPRHVEITMTLVEL